MPGFGSRGGMRQLGVIRQDEPTEKTTPQMPVWGVIREDKMRFCKYVETLQRYLLDHPESTDCSVYIGNGYCTSEDYIQVSNPPHMRELWGKMAKKESGKVIFLV